LKIFGDKLKNMEQIIEISESFLILKNDLIISNIDKALHVIGLINRYEYNFNGRTFIPNNSYRSYTLLCWIFFNIIRYIYFLLVSKDGKVPVSYLDTSQYIGGITQFHRLETLCALISGFVIILIFNYKHDIQWLEIIGILKGLRPMEGIKSFNKKTVEKFVKRIKFMKNLIITANVTTISSLALMAILVNIISLDLINILKFGISGVLMHILLSISYIPIFTYSFLYYYIVCQYCKMRFDSINEVLKSLSSNHIFIEYKKLNDLLAEHDIICHKIISYNKFWKTYYLTINYTLIPLNLLMLQQILFEESNIPTRFALCSIFSLFLGLHLILNSIIASVNKVSSKSCKILQNFTLNSISLLNTKHKIKVLIVYFIK